MRVTGRTLTDHIYDATSSRNALGSFATQSRNSLVEFLRELDNFENRIDVLKSQAREQGNEQQIHAATLNEEIADLRRRAGAMRDSLAENATLIGEIRKRLETLAR